MRVTHTCVHARASEGVRERLRLELFRPYGLHALYGLRARGSYGMTETSPAISMLPAECHTAGNPKLRSVGRPVPWAEVRTHRPPGSDLHCRSHPTVGRARAKRTPAAHGPQQPLRLRFDGASPRHVRCPALHCTALHAANHLRCGGGARGTTSAIRKAHVVTQRR